MSRGSTKRIVYDWEGPGDGPQPGDVLRTKTGRQYTVVESRQVRTRKLFGWTRWRLDVVGPLRSILFYEGGPRVFDLVWKPRRKVLPA